MFDIRLHDRGRRFAATALAAALLAGCSAPSPAPTAAPAAKPAATTAPAAAASSVVPASPALAASPVAAVPSPSAAAAPVAAAKPSGPPLTVRIAQSTPAISFAPLIVARDLGYFEQQGVDLQFTELQSGATAQQALIGGNVNFTDSASSEVAASVSKGVPIIAVQNTILMTQEVCVRKDFADSKGITPSSPLKDRMAALKGATISITGPGSASDRGMRWLLQKYGGLDPNKDVQITQIGGSSAVVGAIEQNRIQAYLQSPPNCEVSAAKGITEVLVPPADVPEWQNYVHEVLYASNDWVTKNKEATTRTATAVSMGNNYMLQHPDESIAILQKEFKSVDPKIIEQVVRDTILPRITKDGKMTQAMWEATNTVLVESGQIAKPVDTKEGVLWTNEYIGNATVP